MERHSGSIPGSLGDSVKACLKKSSNAFVVFRENAQGLMIFIDWQVAGDHFVVAIKQSAVTRRMNGMGKYILFYVGDFDGMTWPHPLPCR